jgi:hypothetical protein
MSSKGVFAVIPTIGNVSLPIIVSAPFSQIPKANGTHGFFYAVDQGTLYFDLGTVGGWVSIFTGGPIVP